MTKPNHWLITATRTLGALTLLVVGGVHYQQYHYDFYSAIPTIGPLFLANAVGATALGLFLLSPVRGKGRVGAFLDQGAALAAIGLAVGAFVGLIVSEHTPLFGFSEHGYRFAIMLALTAEAVTVVLLAVFLIATHRQARLSDSPAVGHAGKPSLPGAVTPSPES
jgi:hypothetical protein